MPYRRDTYYFTCRFEGILYLRIGWILYWPYRRDTLLAVSDGYFICLIGGMLYWPYRRDALLAVSEGYFSCCLIWINASPEYAASKIATHPLDRSCVFSSRDGQAAVKYTFYVAQKPSHPCSRPSCLEYPGFVSLNKTSKSVYLNHQTAHSR